MWVNRQKNNTFWFESSKYALQNTPAEYIIYGWAIHQCMTSVTAVIPKNLQWKCKWRNIEMRKTINLIKDTVCKTEVREMADTCRNYMKQFKMRQMKHYYLSPPKMSCQFIGLTDGIKKS
jgi:hypothetical protein